MTTTKVVLGTLVCALLVAGCAPATYPEPDSGGGDIYVPADPDPAPEPDPDSDPDWPDESDPDTAPGPDSGEPGAAAWTCYYDATFNYDWHDDVVCSNGTEQQRPYLREWDDYVTEDEIMESAREYEQQLNSW